MPAKDQAAYMREYRKRQRRETIMDTTMPAQAVRELVEAQDRIRELESEVARLKRELASRGIHEWPGVVIGPDGEMHKGTNWIGPDDKMTGIRSVLETAQERSARQKLIDATLARVNRTKPRETK